MTFRDYVTKRRITDTPMGDFVTDARRDRTLPDVRSWDELRGYLSGKGACSGAIDAARDVWRQFQKANTASKAA
jgi:hypothetical protein